jgi:Carboxypeptidase regulatory-like domain
MRRLPWRSKLRPLLLLSGVLISADLSAQSRTTSAVRGVVITDDGTPVAQASVTLRHVGTGFTRATLTNNDGRFLLSLLPPGGPYRLTVTALGLADTERTGLFLQVGERQALTLSMKREAFEIEGVRVAVERTEFFDPSQVGLVTRLDEEQLAELPLISRNIMDLAVLSPLVKMTDEGGASVAGQNVRYNAVLVDGVSNKDVFGLTAGGVPGGQAGARMIPLDAVAQFAVLVAPFDVRLSGFTGGVLNAVTRTGTNDWTSRGSVIHRNQSLIGDLNLPTGPVRAAGVNRSLYSFSFGGPLIRDKLHLFVASEFEQRTRPPNGFNSIRDDPGLVRISVEQIERFTDAFFANFDADPGDAGPVDLDTELVNVFARVDWTLGNGHRLTVRNVLAGGKSDEGPNRSQFEPYGLSSNGVLRKSLSSTTSAQLFSDFGTRGANELTISVQRITDETSPVSVFPQVDVDLVSSLGIGTLQREVRAGGQLFAQENDVKQTKIRLSNSLTLTTDSTTYTVGVAAAFYDIQHTFLPAAKGDWFFNNIEDFESNTPQRYQRSVLLDGQTPSADINVFEYGAFAQMEIEATERVTFRFGLRADVSSVLSRPDRNEQVFDVFKLDTSEVPSGQILFSPRIGFNVQRGGKRRSQIRGGFGLFTGQIPFVWLSNAFLNNGLRSVLQVCEGVGNAPGYSTGPSPDTCLSGEPTDLRPIVVFDPDFKYPQELRISAAWDQELTDGTTLSTGLILTHAIRQVVLEDKNQGIICRSGGTFRLDGFGGFERPIFGCMGSNGLVPERRISRRPFQSVLAARNESRDLAFTATAELRGRVFSSMRYQLGYTYGRSLDAMSLSFTDMVSNYGFNATSGDPNGAFLRASNFDRPHKIVVSILGAPFDFLPNTKISLLYTGQSGAPYSYVYQGDLNGDGFPGGGGNFDRFNDLLYVPETADEIPASVASLTFIAYALNNDPCLSKNRGRFLRRNGCRAPWQHRLDLRVSHAFSVGSAQVRFEGDVINVLNALNSSWGNISTVRSNIPLLRVERDPDNESVGSSLRAIWTGAVVPNPEEDGRLRPAAPWTVRSPDSQWQAQFGLRVTLGQRR